jgi:hypothetical protein
MQPAFLKIHFILNKINLRSKLVLKFVLIIFLLAVHGKLPKRWLLLKNKFWTIAGNARAGESHLNLVKYFKILNLDICSSFLSNLAVLFCTNFHVLLSDLGLSRLKQKFKGKFLIQIWNILRFQKENWKKVCTFVASWLHCHDLPFCTNFSSVSV